MNKPTGAVIGTSGDPSVGIWPVTWEISEGFIFIDSEDREDVRGILMQAFGDIAAEPVTVTFSDEITAECEE